MHELSFSLCNLCFCEKTVGIHLLLILGLILEWFATCQSLNHDPFFCSVWVSLRTLGLKKLHAIFLAPEF